MKSFFILFLSLSFLFQLDLFSDPHDIWYVQSRSPGFYSGVDDGTSNNYENGHSMFSSVTINQVSGVDGNKGYNCQHEMYTKGDLNAQTLELEGTVEFINSAGDQGRTGGYASGSNVGIIISFTSGNPIQFDYIDPVGTGPYLAVKSPSSPQAIPITQDPDTLNGFNFAVYLTKEEGHNTPKYQVFINGALQAEGYANGYYASRIYLENYHKGQFVSTVPYTYSQNINITKLVINGEEEDCGCKTCGFSLGATRSSVDDNKVNFKVSTVSGSLAVNIPQHPTPLSNFTNPFYLINNTVDSRIEEQIKDINNQLHQVKNDTGLTQIDVINDDSYTVKQFSIDQVGTKDANGFYTITGDPDTEITYSKTAADPNTLNIEEKKGGAVVSNTSFSYNTTDSKWTMGQDTNGDGTIDRYEYEDETTDGTNTVKTAYILNGDQSVASKIQSTYDADNNLIEEIIDPDGEAITTSYTYTSGNLTRTDYPDGSFETITYTANNLPELTTRSSGLFTKNEYDANERITKIIESFNNSTFSATEAEHKVTTYDYTPVYTGDTGSVEADSPRTVTVSLLGNPVSKTYYGYLANEEHVIQCATPTSGINDAANLVSSTFTDSEDRVIKSIEPDDTGSIITYETVGDTVTTTTESGVFNAGLTAIVQGTETVDIVTNELEVSSHTFDIDSSLLLSSRIITERDSANREKRIDYHDGTYEMFIYGCCNLDSSRSREGIWTDYTYDALGRQVTSKTNGITETTTYDAAGNVDTRTQTGTDSTVRTLVDNDYDTASRLVSTKDALNYETTYSETYAAGQTTSTTTYPNTTTEVTVTDSEGRLVSISGTATFPRTPDLDEERVELDATLGYHVHVQRSGEVDNWVDSYTDALGRVYKTSTITGATAKQFYEDATGRLIKSASQSGAVTLYYEDHANNVQIEALDVNQNDVIDYGIDTITRVQTDVLDENNIVWNRTQTWANPDNLATPGSADNINKVSNDGLLRVNTSITNGISSTFEMQTEVNDDGILTTTATRPDGSYTETKFINGLQEYEKSFDINDTLLHEVTFTYDKFNRLETQTDSRNGTTTYSYNLNDRVLSLTTSDPDGTGPKTAQTFSNVYNNMGRREKVINPDLSEIHFEYTTQGLIEKSYGANVYTRKYIYNNEGQLENIQTWKNATAETGQNDITWAYNAQGQLETETDKLGRITRYTYYPDSGLLHERISPRGITKTYSYDNSGRLNSITYSDGTPSIGFTYTALGQLDTVTDQLGTRTLNYNTLGQYTGLNWNTGFNSGIVQTYHYDTLGRQQSYVRDIGAAQKTVSYNYDSFGRLQKVTNGTREYDYSYLDNAPNTVEKMTVKKGGVAQMHSKREFDKIMRTTRFSWNMGAGL